MCTRSLELFNPAQSGVSMIQLTDVVVEERNKDAVALVCVLCGGVSCLVGASVMECSFINIRLF